MRWGAWLLLISAASACSEPEWDPPPDNAVATCVFEYVTPTYVPVPKSTLYFDANDHIFRVDGRQLDDDDHWVKATFYTDYDDLGRVVKNRDPRGEETYTYGDNEIVVTRGKNTYAIELADGRVVQLGNLQFGYDAAGHLISYDAVDLHETFAYDAQDRVTSISRSPSPQRSIEYTETPDQLIISIFDLTFLQTEIRFDFDAQHRIVHSFMTGGTAFNGDPYAGLSGPESAYVWGDDFIEETSGETTIRATGHCPGPTFITAPVSPIPIQWHAGFVRFANQAGFDLQYVF